MLPRVLAELGEIDLFVHDSIHTERNLRFEFDHARDAMGSDGVLVCDDVHRNPGFRAYAGPGSLVCPSDDRAGYFGIVVQGTAPALSPASPLMY